MDDNIKKNIREAHTWLRLLYMLLFALVIKLGFFVFLVVVTVQFLFVLISGKCNGPLVRFSDVLCQYLYQCFRFVAFNRDDKPFPFSDLPLATGTASDTAGADD